MGNHKDLVREPLRCAKCGRVLAKLDADGTVHIKPAKGPQVIIAPNARVMFICEQISYFTIDGDTDPRLSDPSTKIISKTGERTTFSLFCGNRTPIEQGEVIHA